MKRHVQGSRCFVVLGLLVALAMLVGCAVPVQAPAGGTNQEAAVAATATTTFGMDRMMKITFVTHDLGAGVFAPVRRGMEDACRQINADCEFLGPQTYDLPGQIAILEAALAAKPDAIVTTRVDPSAYNDVLQSCRALPTPASRWPPSTPPTPKPRRLSRRRMWARTSQTMAWCGRAR